MELLPAVYEVKFHFFENQLPKLPNGKYDGMTMIKSLPERADDMMTVDITTADISGEQPENIKTPYSKIANEISDDL